MNVYLCISLFIMALGHFGAALYYDLIKDDGVEAVKHVVLTIFMLALVAVGSMT